MLLYIYTIKVKKSGARRPDFGVSAENGSRRRVQGKKHRE
jgi:hypothetical protein